MAIDMWVPEPEDWREVEADAQLILAGVGHGSEDEDPAGDDSYERSEVA